MQGETLAQLECSVRVDIFGKECLHQKKLLYFYSGKVRITPLALIDDVASISRCGIESVKMNSYLNAKTNLKRLQYGEDSVINFMLVGKIKLVQNYILTHGKLKLLIKSTQIQKMKKVMESQLIFLKKRNIKVILLPQMIRIEKNIQARARNHKANLIHAPGHVFWPFLL